MIGGITSQLTSKVLKPTLHGSQHQRMKDWANTEAQDNKRMNVIGSNGNDGHHYDWSGEYED
jgi:hypothetical protein